MRKIITAALLLVLVGCSSRPTSEWVVQLKAKDGAARLHAIHALSERPGEAAMVVPALSEALKDRDPFVRRDAALALARLGPAARDARPALEPLLKDPSPHVRRAAAAALSPDASTIRR